jgi:hypothetical protein
MSNEGLKGCQIECEKRVWATWSCNSLQLYSLRCTEISRCEMFTAQIFFVQHSGMVNAVALAYLLCSYICSVKEKWLCNKLSIIS